MVFWGRLSNFVVLWCGWLPLVPLFFGFSKINQAVMIRACAICTPLGFYNAGNMFQAVFFSVMTKFLDVTNQITTQRCVESASYGNGWLSDLAQP